MKAIFVENGRNSLRRFSDDFVAPETLIQVPVIGIAPNDFWKKKVGTRGKRSSGKVPEKAWKPFKRLCTACSDRGFPVKFLQFEAGASDPSGLPLITKMSPFVIPGG